VSARPGAGGFHFKPPLFRVAAIVGAPATGSLSTGYRIDNPDQRVQKALVDRPGRR
jgi:hypothetical protein